MRLAVVSLVRNERDVVPAVLRHLAALFDHALLLDHGSVDGTAALLDAACQGRPGWACWRVRVPGYHSQAFTAFAMRHLFETTSADFVIFIDADEFLDIPSRPALEAALARADAPGIVPYFSWLNCFPDRLDGSPVGINDPIWAPSQRSTYNKIVMPRRLWVDSAGRAEPSVGNHDVEAGHDVALTYQGVGHMLHLPVRSAAQIKQKVVAGTMALLGRADRRADESVHWIEAVRRVAEAELTPDDLRGLVADYGLEGAAWRALSAETLSAAGYARRMLDVAAAPAGNAPSLPPPDPWRLMASVLQGLQAQKSSEFRLALNGTDLVAHSAPAESDLPPAQPKAELDKAIRERDAAQDALRQWQASRSYRITAPLRALSRVAALR